MSDEHDNVRELRPPTPREERRERVLLRRRSLRDPKKPFHIHTHFVFDEYERRVECLDCGREVEVFEALMVIARDHGDMADRAASLRAERDRVAKEIEALKVERANLRAAVKRSKLKLARDA